MQDCLNQLGINLVVLWTPNESKSVHGEIKDNAIFLYDSGKAEAWSTFTHEVTEYKLQAVTRPYRILVNNLIEAVEKSIYAEKEQFIEFLPKMIEVIKQRQVEKGKAWMQTELRKKSPPCSLTATAAKKLIITSLCV